MTTTTTRDEANIIGLNGETYEVVRTTKTGWVVRGESCDFFVPFFAPIGESKLDRESTSRK